MTYATNAQAANDSLKERIRALGPWFHNLRLRDVQTAPEHFLGDYPQFKFARFEPALPRDLTGKSVLDIGCNAGFYSFEMKRRGASRVVGIDSDPRYLDQARLAAEVLGHDIEFRQMDVYQTPSLGERFDLVVFMGVLYHLRYPLLALDILRQNVVGDALLFQCMQRGSASTMDVAEDYPFSQTDVFDEHAYPKLHFVERRYAGDPTNWWVPNRSCAEAMLRSAGFSIDARADDDVYLCRVNPNHQPVEGLPPFQR